MRFQGNNKCIMNYGWASSKEEKRTSFGTNRRRILGRIKQDLRLQTALYR
jgi:hypothetical protein